jgi:hypothetical protein
MPKTHFRGGTAYQWVQSFYQSQFPDAGCTGNVFWVNSGTGSDTAGQGFSPEQPFASIAFAITQCTANNNDLILVMANHTETIIAAAGVNVNVAGVTIRGLGTGRQRGSVTYTTSANASFDVNSAGCVIDNLTFIGTGVASVTAMLNVKAADCTITRCEFEHANGTNQAVDVIVTTSAANRLWVWDCFFHGSNNAGTNHAISIVGGDAIEISNCLFQGAYHISQGVVRTVTTDATNMWISYNTIQNQTASNTKAVVLTASTTGNISGNFVQILSGTAPFTGAAMSWVGQNYYANTIATAGTLI